MTATAPKQFPQPSCAPRAASRPIAPRPAPQPPAGDGGRGPRDGDSRGVRARPPAHRNREGSHDARTAHRDVRRPAGSAIDRPGELTLASRALAGAAPVFGTLRPLPGRGPDTWCHRRPIPGACRPAPGPTPSRPLTPLGVPAGLPHLTASAESVPIGSIGTSATPRDRRVHGDIAGSGCWATMASHRGDER